MLRPPDFKTKAHEGGKVVSPTHRSPLPPQKIPLVLISVGVRAGAVGQCSALQAGRSGVKFPLVSLEFSIDTFLPVALWPGG
jgi:hypothetical protein